MSHWDLIVVGGGPAGLMAAGRAAERGLRVLLLERGPSPGRKLLLTGNGRCNVSNLAPPAEFLRAFGQRGGFLRHALGAFGVADLVNLLSQRGVPTAAEPDGRLFPASHDARSVLDALLSYARDNDAEVRPGVRARSLLIEGGRLAGATAGDACCRAPNVLVATGGLSYPATGSTGDGYALAAQAGHAVAPPYPAVVALETRETWPRTLQGTPMRKARVCARVEGGRRLAEATGDALWTHYGVSGPAVLDVSKAVVEALKDGRRVVLEFDLMPSIPEDQILHALHAAAEEHPRQTALSGLSGWVPRRTAAVLLELGGTEAAMPLGRCSKAERRGAAKLLKRLCVHVVGPRPVAEAIVTGGGVDLAQVEPRTMESRLLPGLYFAGEVLDIQARCGGFNLQAALSTGHLAGSSALARAQR